MVIRCLIALAMTGASVVPAARAERAVHLKLTATVVGDRPLPGQAVRLRVQVENVGKEAVGGLLPLENTISVDRVTRGDVVVRYPDLIDLLTDIRRRGPVHGPENRIATVTLEPGERRVVTFPIGTRRNEKGVTALFSEPGKFVVRCQYVYTTRTPRNAPPEGAAGEAVTLSAEVTVEVGKPGPKDAVWTKALAADVGLAATLLQPHEECSADRATGLRDLIAKAPDSTYVNYGRLAVARFHLIGPAAPPKVSTRVSRAYAADRLEEAVHRADYSGFPFRPHVYMNLAEVAPEYVATARRVLDDDYRAAMEWFDTAGINMSPEEWQRFRKEPKASTTSPRP